jgi:hypothetical protein
LTCSGRRRPTWRSSGTAGAAAPEEEAEDDDNLEGWSDDMPNPMEKVTEQRSILAS